MIAQAVLYTDTEREQTLQLAEPDAAEPVNPITTDGEPPRMSQTCSLCLTQPLVTVPGSDVRRCRHCDLPCQVGADAGCQLCVIGGAQ